MRIIIGQEAVCPDGLGRVSHYSFAYPDNYIQVETYFNNRDCKWDPINVTLIPLCYKIIQREIKYKGKDYENNY